MAVLDGGFPVRHVSPEAKIVSGKFVTNGGGAVTISAGRGFSVVRAGAGLYDVTFDRAVRSIEAFIPAISAKTEATELVAYMDQDAETSSVVRVQVSNLAGAVADDAGSSVHFIAIVRTGGYDLT